MVSRAAGFVALALAFVAAPVAGATADAAQVRAGVPPAPAHAGTAVSDSLDLQDVVNEALSSNPEIAEARSLWRAAEAGTPAAGALDDPSLEFMLDRQPFDGGEGMRIVTLTQPLSIFGKRGLKTREARGEAAAVKQVARDAVRRVITEVKSAYFDLFMLERQIVALREGCDALADAVEATRARYATGQAGQQELLLAQAELSMHEGETARAESMAGAARAKLNLLLARDAEAPLGAPRVAGLSAFDAPVEDLVARGRESRPQVLARESELAAAQASERLARISARPDLMLGAGYMWMPGGVDAWRAAVGVTLPVWKGRNQDAMARAAAHRVQAARSGLEDERNRAAMAVEEAYARLAADRELARRYAEEILPVAEMAYESARSAYVTGKEGFPLLLESVRRLTEFRRAYVQYLAGAETELALLEQAVGDDLGAVRTGPDAGLSQGKEGAK